MLVLVYNFFKQLTFSVVWHIFVNLPVLLILVQRCIFIDIIYVIGGWTCFPWTTLRARMLVLVTVFLTVNSQLFGNMYKAFCLAVQWRISLLKCFGMWDFTSGLCLTFRCWECLGRFHSPSREAMYPLTYQVCCVY